MTESEAIGVRHAVRNCITKPFSPTIIDGLKEEIDQCNRLGQLHIQLVAENGEALRGMISLFGRLKKVKNCIALATKKQGGFYVGCGCHGVRLMVRAQQAGLNSCWVTNTCNTKKRPVSLEPHGELAGVITIGHGTTDGTQHKPKSTKKLCKPYSDRWFTDGMNAAVLAPTGLNRQNFFIEASGNTASTRSEDNRLTSQIGIGIARYHFEADVGRENFTWK